MKGKTLFLFTAGYPYGIKDEPFLENEIHYLAKGFEQVVIFPQHIPSKDKRSIPKNVTVNNCITQSDLKKKKLNLVIHLLFVLKIVLNSAKDFARVKSFWKNHRLLLDILAISITHGKMLEKELKDTDLSQVIFYDYWFANAIYSISFLKRKRKIKKFVCRAHRYEIYEENWPTINVPFFEHRIKVVDELYFIAKAGLNHIEQHTPKTHKGKLKLSYLGVQKHDFSKEKQEKNEAFTIVSCARLVNFKRVHLIPHILKNCSHPIKWIHFGDGPLLKTLEENCKELPAHITVELKGFVSNTEVHEYYQTYHVDLFLSISESEGLPVSMMEVLNYGIPILATDAGGISEIANQQTGILLANNCSFEKIAEEIDRIIETNRFDRDEIVRFFDRNYSAKINYEKFTMELNLVLKIKLNVEKNI